MMNRPAPEQVALDAALVAWSAVSPAPACLAMSLLEPGSVSSMAVAARSLRSAQRALLDRAAAVLEAAGIAPGSVLVAVEAVAHSGCDNGVAP